MASASVSLKNATDDFDEALSYALGAIRKKELCPKDEQELAIRHLYEGYDVFLWLPTGFGKSICFECLLFLFDVKLGRYENRSDHVGYPTPLFRNTKNAYHECP